MIFMVNLAACFKYFFKLGNIRVIVSTHASVIQRLVNVSN